MLTCKTQLAFDPGNGWAYGYSNDLLALIIEKVEGKPFGEYFKTEVLEPLEMHHTGFQVQDVSRLTSIHAPGPDGKLRVIESNQHSRYVNGKNYPRGSGGLASTADDYMHVCRMLLNEGLYNGKRLLKPESVKLMMQNVVPAEHLPMKVAGNEMTGQGYGLGLGIVMEGSPFGAEGDVYWPGAVFTYFFVNPEEKTIAIFMTQLYDMSRMDLIWEFHDLATKALEED
ncbi:MAG: serine hydrolase domain-containing protein [Bacteroidia bacterium]